MQVVTSTSKIGQKIARYLKEWTSKFHIIDEEFYIAMVFMIVYLSTFVQASLEMIQWI